MTPCVLEDTNINSRPQNASDARALILITIETCRTDDA
jgi:hypothetical protein